MLFRSTSGMEHGRLRVLIMVQADGTYKPDGTIQFHFKKKRKIERCKYLLRQTEIPFTVKDYEKSDTSVITVVSRCVPLWLRIFRDKTFGTWLFDESADVFFDELPYWDGYHCGPSSLQYSTCNKQNADIVQAFAHISGRSAVIKVKKRSAEHPNWKDAYILDIWMSPGNCHEIRNKPKTLEYSGKIGRAHV